MKLESVQIKSYRSIDDLVFNISPLSDGTFTYGLIGINEVGKSTILKAFALKDGLKDSRGNILPFSKDFRDGKPIEIKFCYTLNANDISECKKILDTQPTPIEIKDDKIKNVSVNYNFKSASPTQPEVILELVGISNDNENINKIKGLIKDIILGRIHKTIFWTAEDRYLISQPINLLDFSNNPDSISIPLRNCFALAGIIGRENIKNQIDLIAESTSREQLKDILGEKVTEHINTAWPKHKIKITFDISDGLINFHIHDLNTKGKAKTADQRSDGFKQFISFLLTVSAQSKNDELSDSILLLDEPETHLHPQAQEDLLKELIKITKNNKNNIVFFATHSNYMIDKEDLSRNYKIVKEFDTTKEKFSEKESTYASVTYEVFEIMSMDYHNELYDKLREEYSSSIDKDNVGILEFENGFIKQQKGQEQNFPYKGQDNKVSLSTYVRNAIHYPQNKDKRFSDYLQKSISILKEHEKESKKKVEKPIEVAKEKISRPIQRIKSRRA